MITQTIVNYLAANRRIVVPQLGAFIVKDPAAGTILFSELLRRDDGVLRGLLTAQGMSEVEAAGRIDRFVFEARHAIRQGESFPLEGLGCFRPGEGGTMLFEPQPAEPSAPQPAETAAGNEPAERTENEQARTEEQTIRQPKVSVSAKMQPEPYVKGLRYGTSPNRARGSYGNDRRRRPDKFLIVAIVTAVLALGAIAFGYYVSKSTEAITREEAVLFGE